MPPACLSMWPQAPKSVHAQMLELLKRALPSDESPPLHLPTPTASLGSSIDKGGKNEEVHVSCLEPMTFLFGSIQTGWCWFKPCRRWWTYTCTSAAGVQEAHVVKGHLLAYLLTALSKPGMCQHKAISISPLQQFKKKVFQTFIYTPTFFQRQTEGLTLTGASL